MGFNSVFKGLNMVAILENVLKPGIFPALPFGNWIRLCC